MRVGEMAGWQDYNEQTNFLAQFLWSPEFSPKTVAETYKTRLPVIVKVTSGYDGCDGMHEFAMEEVSALYESLMSMFFLRSIHFADASIRRLSASSLLSELLMQRSR